MEIKQENISGLFPKGNSYLGTIYIHSVCIKIQKIVHLNH